MNNWKWMPSKHDGMLYLVNEETLHKMKNFRYIKLHDVLEQRNGHNLVFSYRFTDDLGDKRVGYRTVWQDRDDDEYGKMMEYIIAEQMNKLQNII